jgi:hypothetical protein
LVESGESKREIRWTECIATGSNEFAENILLQLGLRAKGRKNLIVWGIKILIFNVVLLQL